MFDASRALEVIVRPSMGGGAGYGSGYYIGGGLVVTCSHVLVSNDPVVRGIDGHERAALVAWRNPEDDVAFLRIDGSSLPGGVVPIGFLPHITTNVHVRFVMYGWPKAGDVGQRRNPVQVDGTIRLAELAGAKTGTVRLRPGEGAGAADMWRGMSGAAIICDDLLVAIQVMQANVSVQFLEALVLTDSVLSKVDEYGKSGTALLSEVGIPFGVQAPSSLLPVTQLDLDVQSGRLPSDVVSMMENIGRHDIDPLHSKVDLGEIWAALYEPLYEYSQRDPEAFISDLSNAVRPAGGWALYGAAHVVKELLGVAYESPACRMLVADSLEFLRSRGVPNLLLRTYEWEFWVESKATNEQWLTGRPKPSPQEAPIRKLGRGEVRRVAQAFRDYDSPVVFVGRADNGSFVALVETRNSDDDPTRSMRQWKSADTLNDLYWIIGTSYQVPTYWYDPELAPYFPLPPPRLY